MAFKRAQIYLDRASDDTLRKLAKETGLSAAEHIRRAVRAYIKQYPRSPVGDRSDPLLELIGICDDPNGPQDAALHHDRYLYGRAS